LSDKDVAAGGAKPPVRTADEIARWIQAHADEFAEGGMLTDWFVAYSVMKPDPDSPTGISYTRRYLTSDTSPNGALGIAHLCIGDLDDDLRCTCPHGSCDNDD
jgi:hypothetical protein